MVRNFAIALATCLSLVAVPATQFAQGNGRAEATKAVDPNQKFDPHDFSGVWMQSGGARGINKEKLADVPEFTPKGQKMFDANLPARGRLVGEPLNGDHPGLVRARPPALSNDPIGICTPQGVTRLL